MTIYSLSLDSILKIAYLGGNLAIVLWNVFATNRIVHDPRAPRFFLWITGLSALLILPALLIAISGASVTYGSVMQSIIWLWPLTATLFSIQAAYSLVRRMVNPIFGTPIFVYNVTIAAVAIAHLANNNGWFDPVQIGWGNRFLLALSAAQGNAVGHFIGPHTLGNSMWVFVPLFAPALPSRSRLKAAIRTVLAIAVIAATAVTILEIPNGYAAITSYDRYQNSTFQERAEDLKFGLRVLPVLHKSPATSAVKRDLHLFDSLNFNAVSVIVKPSALAARSLDSISRVIDMARAPGTTVIVALGYPEDAAQLFQSSPEDYIAARMRDLDRIARAFKPTVILPAEEPYGQGMYVLGNLSPEFWIDYFTRAAETIKAVNPNIYVGLSASSFGPRDSTLYSWAAQRGSPVDIPGFTFFPGFDGAVSLDTKLRIATRWMKMIPNPKIHWVWATGGYPILHGQASHREALKGAISWAAAHTRIRGVVIWSANDYEVQIGLESPGERLRLGGRALYSIIQRYED